MFVKNETEKAMLFKNRATERFHTLFTIFHVLN